MNEHSKTPAISIDWKPIILWGGGSGAAIGLWWGLWFTGFLLSWDRGWFFRGIEISSEDPLFLRVPTKLSLGWLADLLGCAPPESLSVVLLWIVAVGAVTGAGLVSVGRLIGIDRNLLGLNSFLWSIRAMISPMVVVLTIALMGTFWGVFALESAADEYLYGWLAVVGVLALFWLSLLFVGIPVLVCRRDVAGRTPAPWWWWPDWPGWKTVSVVVGVTILAYGPGLVFDWVAKQDALSGFVLAFSLADVAWSTVMFVSPLALCAVLMQSDMRLTVLWRQSFRWKSLGPWLTLHGWWGMIGLVLAPPVVAVYVWLWKVVPVWATVLESRERFIPYYWRLFINTSNLIGNFWWLLFTIPIMFFFWLGVARLVVLIEHQSRPKERTAESEGDHIMLSTGPVQQGTPTPPIRTSR